MSAISYKCPNCGGDLQFDPESQQYKCEYCLSKFNQEELEQSTPLSASEQKREEAPLVYTCPSCGAEIVTDETTAATFCFYCHNPIVLKGRLEGEYLPQKVIPFQISRQKAEEEFLSYVGKRRFVPKAFFQKKQIEKMTGVYFPYWVCTEQLDGKLEASATKVRVWHVGDLEHTETKFFRVEREGSVEVRDMTRNALSKAEKKLVEGVRPFPMEQCKPFSMGYLSGFQAEKRDMEKEAFEQELHKETEEFTERLLRNSAEGYTSVVPKKRDVRIRKENWAYVLLPVWTLTYRGKGDHMYYYAMNGVTGKVCGELPVDYRKVTLLAALIFVVVFALGLMGGYLI
jgi:DNA-directed RNA polymerase subunit RPC12/RpoP